MDDRLSAALRAWYEANKRDLKWRRTRDPYRIWLSETILQQTRVQQGAAYYDRFLEAFPTVAELAAAPDDRIMKLWQGLGYYSRARNLHAAARQIADRFGGRFPDRYEDVRSLPGVGDYTAAAVCSFAYDLPHAVVDGNVYRVYARLFDMELPIDTTAGRKAFAALAGELLDRNHPAQYNQAVMEFGALHCTPNAPQCTSCPFADRCLALAAGTVALRPVKAGRTAVRDRYLNYIVPVCDGRTLIRRRSGRDIWQGLYEFPLIETPAAVEFEQLPLEELLGREPFRLLKSTAMPRHQLSHQTLHARFHRIGLDRLPGPDGYLAVPIAELGGYAVPRLIEKYLYQSGFQDF